MSRNLVKNKLEELAESIRFNIDKFNGLIPFYLIKSVKSDKEICGTVIKNSIFDMRVKTLFTLTKNTVSLELKVKQYHLKIIKKHGGIFWHTHPWGDTTHSKNDLAHFEEAFLDGYESIFVTICFLTADKSMYKVEYLFIDNEYNLNIFSYIHKLWGGFYN